MTPKASTDTPSVETVIQRCMAASYDDRLADGMLYRQAADLLSTLQHERNLIDADTQRGITDCSTPLFQRVRNIVEQLEAAEAEARAAREALEQAFAAGFQWAINGTDKHGDYNGGPVESGFSDFMAALSPKDKPCEP